MIRDEIRFNIAGGTIKCFTYLINWLLPEARHNNYSCHKITITITKF